MFLCVFLLFGLLQPAEQLSRSQLVEKSQQGKQALEQGRFDEAAAIYAELVRALPRNAGLKINLGMALSMAGRPREAMAQFEAASKLQPDLVDAWVLLGAARLEAGEHHGAVPPLQKALELAPAHQPARQMLAEALLGFGQFREASRQLVELARVNPLDAKAWYGLGRAYEALSQQEFEELRKAAGESPYWLAMVGEALARQGKHSNAFFFFRRALEKSSHLRGVHAAIADLYRVTGHAEWAAIEAAKETSIPPVDCAIQKLECAFHAGRYQEVTELAGRQADAAAHYWAARAFHRLALESFARLGGLAPSAELYKFKAGVLSNQGQHREAAALLKDAVGLAPKDLDAKKRLAEALYHSRDLQAAQPLLKELLSSESNSPELNFLYGETLLQLQQGEEAVVTLKRAVAADLQSLPAHAALGRAYLHVGKVEEALPHLERALKVDEDGSLHYQLARAYQITGKTDLARAMLERYQEIQKSRKAENEKMQEDIKITPP